MTSEQAIEVGKALLPYLRTDLRPEELGMAAHDAAAALSRTGGRGELVKRAAMIERERIASMIEGLDNSMMVQHKLAALLRAPVTPDKGGHL
jgi:hypothetical protein